MRTSGTARSTPSADAPPLVRAQPSRLAPWDADRPDNCEGLHGTACTVHALVKLEILFVSPLSSQYLEDMHGAYMYIYVRYVFTCGQEEHCGGPSVRRARAFSPGYAEVADSPEQTGSVGCGGLSCVAPPHFTGPTPPILLHRVYTTCLRLSLPSVLPPHRENPCRVGIRPSEYVQKCWLAW